MRAGRLRSHASFVCVAVLSASLVMLDAKVAHASFTPLFPIAPTRPSVNVTSTLFPPTIPGFEQELGINLPSGQATGPAWRNSGWLGKGVRVGPVFVEPALEIGSTYDSNVLGVRGGPGSEILRVAPAISAQADWSRAAAAVYLGINHNQYLQTPNQTRTDVTLALGGNVTIGRGKLSVGYSHLRLHDDPATIGSIPSSTPTPIDIDSVRTNYDISIGRFSLNPFIEASHYSYGKTLIGGVEQNQSFRNRSLVQAGSAARFNLGERRDALVSISLVRTSYDRAQAGQPSASSTGVVALGGLDYQVNGTLDTRVLVGVQSRSFDTSAYRSRVIPVGMVSATWWGQRQTAVALTLSRSLEDLAEEDTGGSIYTRGEILVTHEARPNLVLRARTGAARAEFLTRRATEAYVYGGTGLEWTINRGVKFQADAEIRRNSAPTTSGLSSSASGPYTRAIAHVGFVFTL